MGEHRFIEPLVGEIKPSLQAQHFALAAVGSRKNPKPACPGGSGRGKRPKNAQSPRRPVHYPGVLPGRCVRHGFILKNLCNEFSTKDTWF